MKITNLIDNVNKQTLSITSSVWNWFNGLLIGALAVAAAFVFSAFGNLLEHGLNLDVKYNAKKKK